MVAAVKKISAAQNANMSKKEVEGGKEQARKTTEDVSPGSINIWERCKEIDNPEDEAFCATIVTESKDVKGQIGKNQNRILDRLTNIDEFGELFPTVFKNTIVGLVKRAQGKEKESVDVLGSRKTEYFVIIVFFRMVCLLEGKNYFLRGISLIIRIVLSVRTINWQGLKLLFAMPF